jgi:hypothetical protein
VALQSTTIFIKKYQGIVLDEGKLWEVDRQLVCDVNDSQREQDRIEIK